MNKLLRPRFLPIIVMLCSILGILLRLWTIGPGPDADGLYPPQTLAWVLLWVFTAITAVVILLSSMGLKKTGPYEHSYPKSILGAIGSILAAAAILIYAIKALGSALVVMDTITAVLGILSGIAMLVTAYFRFQGKKPPFLLHCLVCIYFALRAFNHCRGWSNEPQIGVFIFSFLASVSIMLALYQRACFDVDLGKRSHSLFWSMLSVYLCLVAMPGESQLLFYGAMALWMITNVCSLSPVPQAPAAEPQPDSAEE